MKNHSGIIFTSHLELFNGGSRGRAYGVGGVGFILACETEGLPHFWKRHIFKATGWANQGEADGGVF